MSSKPLVSSIIIFLNAEKFIEEAIESVFAQTYESWELLLVDDGSTDDSTAIARRYAEEHPGKVRYLEHSGHCNRGMSASRNLGISCAEGKYVAFLDADDVWLAHKLERQVAILNSHPEAGMVYGSTQYWYSWTENPKDAHRDFVPGLGISANTLFKPPVLLARVYPLGNATAPSISNLMLRREVLERVGGFEESFKGMYEDRAFLSKVFLKETVFVVSEWWDRYRQHPDSCFAAVERTGQHHTVRLFFLAWLEEYLVEQEAEGTEVWKLLRREQVIAQVRFHAQEREWKQAIMGFVVLVRYHPKAFTRVYQRLRLRAKLRGRPWSIADWKLQKYS